MISRFFIDRPVLANVLALVFVLIGLVSLVQLPTAQYPNVVPPTVQVTTRYPGASAKTLVDTVALPIEQQVNGVENMLYMQSTSANDGTYTLVVTFAIGTDPDKAQILVQNHVAAAISSLPQEVQAQGVTTAKKSTLDSRIRRLDFARQPLRQPVLVQLRRHQRSERTGPPQGRRRRDDLRRRAIRHAHLDESRPASGAGPDAAGRDQRRAAAEPGSRGRPGRRAAGAERPGLPVYARPQRPAGRSCRV